MTARPGQEVTLSAAVSDPDGDTVAVKWWHLDNHGTYTGDVTMQEAEGRTGSFRVPADAKRGDTIHIIAEANDNSTKVPLTRYARTIVTIR
jgi:protocatechuate 3,4-dioxygenase beta subunit